jgi:hypothetical protein
MARQLGVVAVNANRVPNRIVQVIAVLNCVRLVFEPLKKVTIEAFWYALVLREILHYFRSW